MRRWILLYLVLVLLTTAVISVLIYVGISLSLATKKPAAIISEPATTHSGQQILLAWPGFKLSLLLLLVSGLMISIGLGYAWYRITAGKFDRRMRILTSALDQLARGQLNETVTIDTADEFSQMGASINELAANLQELLLYIWKQTGQCLTLLERVQNNPDLRHDRRLTLESLGYLKQLAESIVDLREMAKSYVFYDVSLDGNKTQAISEPGKDSASDQTS